MGRAKIVSHKGDALYEVTYYRDTDKVEKLKEQLETQITEIDERLTVLNGEIIDQSGAVASIISDMQSLINIYKSCVDEKSPEGCIVESTAVTEITKLKIEEEALLNLLIEEENRLLISKDRYTKEKERLELAPQEEEIIDVWCMDLCARPVAEAPVGDYANVDLVIPNDTEVGIIELFNWETKSYERWIPPSAGVRDNSYIDTEHGVSKPSLSSNAEGFVYNFEMRSPTFIWKTQYRIGIIESIDSDNYQFTVSYAELKDELGVDLQSGLKKYSVENKIVDVDYMDVTSDPYLFRSTFLVGDEMVIKFDANYTNPTCIGFRDHPKRGIPTQTFVFWAWTAGKQIRMLFDPDTNTWTGSNSSNNHGYKYWHRGSDGTYISYSPRNTIGSANDIWVNGVKYVINTASLGFSDWYTYGVCLDENDDLKVFGAEYAGGTWVLTYDWSTWTKMETVFTDHLITQHVYNSEYLGYADEAGTAFYIASDSGIASISTETAQTTEYPRPDYVIKAAFTDHPIDYGWGVYTAVPWGWIKKTDGSWEMDAEGSAQLTEVSCPNGYGGWHKIAKFKEVNGYQMRDGQDIELYAKSYDDGYAVFPEIREYASYTWGSTMFPETYIQKIVKSYWRYDQAYEVQPERYLIENRFEWDGVVLFTQADITTTYSPYQDTNSGCFAYGTGTTQVRPWKTYNWMALERVLYDSDNNGGIAIQQNGVYWSDQPEWDLGRSSFESELTSLGVVMGELTFIGYGAGIKRGGWG